MYLLDHLSTLPLLDRYRWMYRSVCHILWVSRFSMQLVESAWAMRALVAVYFIWNWRIIGNNERFVWGRVILISFFVCVWVRKCYACCYIAAGYGGRVFAPFHVIECNVVGKRAIEIEHGFSSKYFVLSFFLVKHLHVVSFSWKLNRFKRLVMPFQLA